MDEDAEFRWLMEERRKAKELTTTFRNGKERMLAGPFLNALLLGWGQFHIQWEAYKRHAAKLGVNTSVFRRGLGRQVDDLNTVIKTALQIQQDYGPVSQQGIASIRQRIQRITGVLNDYERICVEHRDKPKRTETERLAWEFLRMFLDNCRGNFVPAQLQQLDGLR